jgi:anti-sigma regulatory factor (Ser/Thr protein kinase)
MASETERPGIRDFSLGKDLGEFVRLSAAVHEFLRAGGVADETLFTVELALEEVVTNILKYAALDPVAGRITVHLERTPERVLLVIEDNGRQFDPVQAAEPDLGERIEDRPVGGAGLGLLRRMVQLLRYQRRGANNHLEIGIDRLSG